MNAGAPPRAAVGVLALQGDYAAHVEALRAAASREGLAVDVRLVRRPRDLEGLGGLAMPGGESTTMLKLLKLGELDVAITSYARAGGAILATCAGAILLAREVENPAQASLGLLDARIERNSYGRQIDSFVTTLSALAPELGAEPLEAVFIRAPRFLELGSAVEVLASAGDDPVLVRQGRILAATFHPELSADFRVAALFLRMACAPIAAA